MADPGEGPPLILDQTEARRAETIFFWTPPRTFSEGLDDRPRGISRYGSHTVEGDVFFLLTGRWAYQWGPYK